MPRIMRRVPFACAITCMMLLFLLCLLRGTDPMLELFGASPHFDGSGTRDDPYLIRSPEDLVLLRDLTNEGSRYAFASYALDADLDMSSVASAMPRGIWVPVGLGPGKNAFCGSLDGRGHHVSGIACEGQGYAGLFGYLRGAVSNLELRSCRFWGMTAGSIAGQASRDALVLNCVSDAEVMGYTAAGGMVGITEAPITFCWFTGWASVIEGDAVGGISATCPPVGIGNMCLMPPFSQSGTSASANEAFTVWDIRSVRKELAHYQVANAEVSATPALDGNKVVLLGVGLGSRGYLLDLLLAYLEDMSLLPHMVVLALACGAMLAGRTILGNPRMTAQAESQTPAAPTAVGVGRHVPATAPSSARHGRPLASRHSPRSVVRRLFRGDLTGDSARSTPVGAASKRKADADRGGALPVIPVRRLVNVAAVVIVLCVAGQSLNAILEHKSLAGAQNLESLYRQEAGSIEVLIVGSSKASTNISIERLWSDEGIAAYSVFAGMQPMWSTYAYLKEALRSQRPKVVCLEASALSYGFDYLDEGGTVDNNQGISSPFGRLRAVRASSEQKDWLDRVLGIPLYHMRFAVLGQGDFDLWQTMSAEDHKGETVFTQSSSRESLSDPTSVWWSNDVTPKEELYFRACIELLQSRDIPVLLLATTHQEPWYVQGYYNRGRRIANEYGVPTLDINKVHGLLGFAAEDLSSDDWHQNTWGARKTSAVLGPYLVKRFGVGGHAGDPRYASWDRFARSTQNRYLSNARDVADLFSELHRDGRAALLTIPYVESLQPGYVEAIVTAAAEEGLHMGDAFSSSRDAVNLWYSGDTSTQGALQRLGGADSAFCDHHVQHVIRNGTDYLSWADEGYYPLQKGVVSLFVYDEETDEVVAAYALGTGSETADMESIGVTPMAIQRLDV